MLYAVKENSVSLGGIAKQIGASLKGDPELRIKGLCSLDEQRDDCLAFSTVQGAKAAEKVLGSLNAQALMLRDSLEEEGLQSDTTILYVKEPLPAMVSLIPLFFEQVLPERSISDKADVDPGAEIGKGVHIGAFCSIGKGAKILDGAILYPNVVVYPGAVIGQNAVLHSGAIVRERCKVGAGCTIQNGAIVGADGFGYMPTPKGLKPVPQVGITALADDVDIGANSCVDRGTLGTTSIGLNSKVDNLAQIGHNVSVGMSTVICGDVAIGGSTKIGNGVMLGGAVSLADHLIIDDGVRFSGRAAGGHINHYKKDDYMGYPALPAGEWLRMQTALRKLPELRKRVAKLEKKVVE